MMRLLSVLRLLGVKKMVLLMLVMWLRARLLVMLLLGKV
jgi:hypothetical protein